MALLHEIVARLKGSGCQKLFQTTGQEFKISGAGIEGGGVKFNVGEFSNQIKQLVSVPDLSFHLDNTQYLLCDQISKMEGNSKLKEDFIRIRMSIIVAFNMLANILTSIKEEPSEELKKQLTEWLQKMEDLHKHSLSILDPAKAEISKSSMPFSEILRYQGIKETELKDAVRLYNA